MPACTICTSTDPTTRAEGAADSAEEAGAAEHRGGDHVELLADAEGLVQPADERDQVTPPSAAHAADDVDREDDAIRVDAGLPRRLGVVTDGVELTAELSAGEHHCATPTTIAKTTIGIGTPKIDAPPKAVKAAG